MKISGFTIIRNGESLGYPYKESLLSLAPFVSEIVVAHGDSTDNTLAALEALKTKLKIPLRIIHSPWDAESQKGGHELARQSNIALDHCENELCFYLQGDELLADFEEEILWQDIKHFANDPKLSALALNWVHFYGNFKTIVYSKQWYRREVRLFKKSHGLRSFRDAQGFRIPRPDGTFEKPHAALSRAHVYHVGWVRPPKVMAEKSQALDRLWHGSAKDGQHDETNVYPPLYGMKKFSGPLPKLLADREAELRDFDPFQAKKIRKNLKFYRLWLEDWIEKFSGHRPGEFKNFKIVKRYH